MGYRLEDFKPAAEGWRYDRTYRKGQKTYGDNLTISVNVLTEGRAGRLPEELRRAAEAKVNMLLEVESVESDTVTLAVFLCCLCTMKGPVKRAMWVEVSVEGKSIRNRDHCLEGRIDMDEGNPLYNVCKEYMKAEADRILFG